MLTHANLNKVLGVIVSKASNPVPKLSPLQNAYVNECSCFIISSLMKLYPDYASTISPTGLEHLLSKFLSSCGRQTKTKTRVRTKTRMMGGTLALRNPRKAISGSGLFAGVMLLIYALFVARASLRQLNAQNPFRKPEYTMLNLVKEETVMVQITQENLMQWVRHPSMQLASATNTLSMQAIKIVGRVTHEYTEGLEQAVSEHCLGESSASMPELHRTLDVPEPETAPQGRWSAFASQSWSTLSGYATPADQAVDRLAKVHIAAANLFDMPGCMRRVHDIKSQELMYKIRNEHAKLKLDIENWGKKGQNDINLVFSLFYKALTLIFGSFGFSVLSLRGTQRSITKEAYNLNDPRLADKSGLTQANEDELYLPPRLEPVLDMPQLSQQPYLRPLQLEPSSFLDQRPGANRHARALLEVQSHLDQVIRPALNRVHARVHETRQQEEDMREHRKRVVAEAARQQEAEAQEARRRQEEFAILKGRVDAYTREFRGR